jgi:two-component system, OmpR family, sensor histidine kinase BaeS
LKSGFQKFVASLIGDRVWRIPLSVRLAGMMVSVVMFTMFVFIFSFGVITSIRYANMPKDQRDHLRQLQDNGITVAPESLDQITFAPNFGNSPTASTDAVLLLNGPLNISVLPPNMGSIKPPRRSDFLFKAVGSSQLIGILISSLIGVLLATVFSRRLVQPLEAVSRAAKKMSNGDLTARVPIIASRLSGEPEDLAINFNAMAQSLERQERERKNMVADIAHELRTPIGVMQAKLEAIEDGVFELSIDEVKKLSRQTRLLARLVEDLRTLSLADAGQLRLETRKFNLANRVREVTSGFEPSAQSKHVQLEVIAPEKLELYGDPDRISQVISNLLDNALRYTPEHGTVRVTLEAQAKQARVIVSDSGHGLPSDSFERVFDRFYRVDESRNRSSGGSGLGLAIAKTILELHGGGISVSNRAEGGAQFVCALPVA